MQLEPVIGLEVHAQLKTNTKLFCGCSTKFGDQPNANVCPVCLGMPGALPVLNKRAVEMAVMAGYALNCSVEPLSVFSRKNYFYPDLPKGYQISQFDLPVCLGGHLEIATEDGLKKIGITRIHMEEDAGKLLHQGADSIAGATASLVDLNRACTPLIEIVSEPDIRSGKEARAYVETLRQILRHIGVCDGNLEEGSMRVDINLSLRPVGQTSFGTRTEVKNVNSFRSIERAIQSEMVRQSEIILSGGHIVQQTRNYHDDTQTTTPLRDKEEAHDYRYFPEPDLIPLKLSPEFLSDVKRSLPELPEQKVARYQSEYGLSDFECKVLMGDLALNAYFESGVKIKGRLKEKELCKWIIGDLNSVLKDKNLSFGTDNPISEGRLVELLELVDSGKISGKIAKGLLPKMIESSKSPKELVDEAGISQISDSGSLQPIIDKILDANPDVIEKVKGGKVKSADFLMGQVMRETRGQAKPDLVRELILKSINAR